MDGWMDILMSVIATNIISHTVKFGYSYILLNRKLVLELS